MLGATEEIGPERQFLAFLAEGRFMLQRSKAAGACFFYPRVAAPGTGEGDLEWVEVSGRGRVYSTTVIRARPPAPSYNVALIDLEEGPRMMSRVEGIPPEAVAIGMAVTAAIVPGEPHPHVIFRPAA